jgi:hypothetical protein
VNLVNFGSSEFKNSDFKFIEFEFKDSKFTKFSCTGQCEINVYGCMFVMVVGDEFLSMS